METAKENDAQMNRLGHKLFVERKSLLTELLEVKHFKTIRHTFLAVLFGFVVNDFISFLVDAGEYNFGLRLIKIGFGKFHMVVILWMLAFSVNLLTYAFFKRWANLRKELEPKSLFVKLWDVLWLSIFIAYYIGALCFMPIIVIKLDLPAISSVIVVAEQVRLVMKTHAFVRSNAPKILNFKPHTDNVLQLPAFSHYVYFSFAPTLVYRDEYPRTKEIKWSYAIRHFVEVLAIIWLQSFVFERCFVKKFENFGKETTNWNGILLSIFENSIAGVLILVSNFYLILHSWLNGFAELLRFADRKFYEDWWTATNFGTYYRTWNIVVHDWLYTYVYKDIYEIVTQNNKVVSKIMVFFISALVHEYILCFMLKMFFPVLFTFFFTFGVLFTFIYTKHPMFNVLFLYSMALGMSIQLSLYTIKYAANQNCQMDPNETLFNSNIMISPCNSNL